MRPSTCREDAACVNQTHLERSQMTFKSSPGRGKKSVRRRAKEGEKGVNKDKKMKQWSATIDGMRKTKQRQRRENSNKKKKKRMVSRSKSRKTIGPCSSSVQASTFRRFPMSPLEQREGRSLWVMRGWMSGLCARV